MIRLLSQNSRQLLNGTQCLLFTGGSQQRRIKAPGYLIPLAIFCIRIDFKFFQQVIEKRAFAASRRSFENVNFILGRGKISVKGKNMHPVYKWLTSKKENGVSNSSVKWNFQKYMINEDGTLEGYVGPRIKPFDKKILAWLEAE